MKKITVTKTRTHIAIALIISILIAVASGWREVGFDRENYIEMFNGIVSSDEFEVKLWYAKDIIFLAISLATNYFSPEAKLSFLIVCLVSILLKKHAIQIISPTKTLPFVILYSIFLAPGLEFAAMRAGLAVAFLTLALAHKNNNFKFIFFSTLAISSHLSTIPGVILSITYVNKLFSNFRFLYFTLGLVTLIAGEFLITLFPHGGDYEGNKGTLAAFSSPLCTLFIAWLIFFPLRSKYKSKNGIYAIEILKHIQTVAYGLIYISFGLVSTVVTASTRYLEISWCLILIAALILVKKSFPSLIGFFLFLIFLSYLNIIRNTWLAIISPTFGNY